MSPNFLKDLKEALGLKYTRSDVRLLTDADFLYLSAHVQSEQAINLNQSYFAFIIQQTRESMVSREEYMALKIHYDKLEEQNAKMEERLSRLEAEKAELAQPLRAQASAAGQTLSLHRYTKEVRNLPN
jgi:hypothetical protein